MKVTTDTPDLLIVEDRPLLIGIMLSLFILVFVGVGLSVTLSGEPLGLIFAIVGGGLGLFAFWAFVQRVQAVFHKPGAWVELRRRTIFGGTTVRHALDEIDRAEIEESRSSDSASTYRVVLVIEAGQSLGRHPVTEAYSSGAGHHRAAEAINRWLDAARADANETPASTGRAR
ncbi:hypothetical protein [Sinisalibacter aestuarii]|uniref:Uncharacterized protein n=1 Tax=Sinisalibacter aestuarii TaxID=2949426 RepID=A0ABQ5LTD6_9RHOB|nr:hypothetical protein [Sinisalibacter aestuarii]GKY88250.1 hypothetical protein STA1M1_21190 [Sinisalibacter aestuarii]